MASATVEQTQGSRRLKDALTRVDFPALGYALLPAMLALRYVNAPPDNRTYGPSHWFLNYHHGFMRRALVGQMFSAVHTLSWRSIFLIEAAVLFCAVGLTYAVFARTLFGTIEERRLAVFLLAAPSFLPHMAMMGGEMDNFLYLALVPAAFALVRLSNLFGLLLATVFACVALAIHEGFLLMFYPLILVLLIDLVHRGRLKRTAVGLHCGIVAACFVAILAFGKVHGTETEWTALAQQRTDMPVEHVVYIALHNSFREQLRFVRQCYSSRSTIMGILTKLLLSIPYGVMLVRAMKASIRSRGYAPTWSRAVFCIFLAPLLMLPLGHDVIRWVSALCINVSLYILLLYQSDAREALPGPNPSLYLTRWTASPAYSATLLYLVAVGPWNLGTTALFFNLRALLHKGP